MRNLTAKKLSSEPNASEKCLLCHARDTLLVGPATTHDAMLIGVLMMDLKNASRKTFCEKHERDLQDFAKLLEDTNFVKVIPVSHGPKN
jgi:hypothetical protein